MNPEFGPIDIEALYESQADSFDGYAFHSPNWEKVEKPSIVRNLIDDVDEEARIVDLGCGSGRLIEVMVGLGADPFNITGIDLSQNLINKAALRFPNATFVHGSAENIPIEDESIDLIASSMAFQYFDAEVLKKVLQASARCLKIGGTLFFIAPHPLDSADFDPKKYGKGWFEVNSPWGGSTPNYGHTVGNYIRSMMEAGFEIENIEDLARPIDTFGDEEKLYRIAVKGVKKR